MVLFISVSDASGSLNLEIESYYILPKKATFFADMTLYRYFLKIGRRSKISISGRSARCTECTRDLISRICGLRRRRGADSIVL